MRRILEIIEAGVSKGSLLDAIMDVQKVDGYISESAIKIIAEAFEITAEQVYETASFYSMVRLEKSSKIDIKICKSAPCHVAGAKDVIKTVEELIGIDLGSKSNDGKYTFDTVECLGQCGNGPTMLINGKIYNDLNHEKVIEIIEKERNKI